MRGFLHSLLRCFRRESEWREEIESHLAMRAEWNAARGLPPEEASAHAARQFGSRLRVMESVRAVHVRSWMDALLLDLRHAARGVRRSPGFTLVGAATLAIGIGASAAVFSVVDLLLFRSLPYPQADRLVSIGFSGPIDTNEFNVGGSYLDWRDSQTAFVSIGAMIAGGHQCDLGAEPAQRLECDSVDANFLRTLGVVPVAGRDFHPEEDRPHAPKVALLSYGLWRSRFAADPAVVGSTVQLDDEPVRVIGVLPRTFEMPQLGQPDILLPAQMDERAARRPNSTIMLRTFARLKDGVSIEAARQMMMPLFEASVRRYVPPSLRSEVRLVVRSLRDRQIHDIRTASWLLFGSVLALLALACANVANLMLARAAARSKELAMRAALGAGRVRLAAQMLTEGLVLSLLGGVAGCGFAWGLLRLFVAIVPEGITRLNQARIDQRVLLFALGSAILSAICIGQLPAWESLRGDSLAGWRAIGAIRSRTRQMLVAAQVALSLVLLTGASLLVRSLWKLEAEPLGFQPERVITASLRLNPRRYNSAPKRDAFYAAIEQRLAHIPGVTAFALSDSVPPAGAIHDRPFSNMRVAGHPPLPENGGMVAFRYVSPGYFRTLGIPIVAGRNFTESERLGDQTPLILSAALARRIFGAENPIGQQLDLEDEGHWLPIVGVAADVKNSGLAETPEPEYYRLRTDRSTQLGPNAVAIMRTGLDENAIALWIRREVAAIDANVPVTIEAMPVRVGRLSSRARFTATLIGLFAAFGLLLAAVGLYGVLSFLVAQRTREIGVRMALGATPRTVAWLMGQQALAWTAWGATIGLAGSLALSRFARAALFRVSPYDPVSLAAAVAVLGIAAVLAAWLPARRASGMDPAVSLREE